jgi:trehalose-6-phosphate synthase
MTTLLAKAFAEAMKLSPEEQDAFARWMLDELEDEARWSRSFAESLDILEQLADEALDELRAGKTKRLIGCGG